MRAAESSPEQVWLISLWLYSTIELAFGVTGGHLVVQLDVYDTAV